MSTAFHRSTDGVLIIPAAHPHFPLTLRDRTRSILWEFQLQFLEKAKEKLEQPLSDNFIRKKVEDSVYEAYLAKKLAEEGLIRNACGKAFQAWKDLLSALLYLKKEEIVKLLDDKQREWLLEKGIYAPSSRLSPLSKLLEEVGVEDVTPWTAEALRLHTYQYHGPDPEGLWGGPVDKEDAKEHLELLLKKWKEYLEKYLGNYLNEELREVLNKISNA